MGSVWILFFIWWARDSFGPWIDSGGLPRGFLLNPIFGVYLLFLVMREDNVIVLGMIISRVFQEILVVSYLHMFGYYEYDEQEGSSGFLQSKAATVTSQNYYS